MHNSLILRYTVVLVVVYAPQSTKTSLIGKEKLKEMTVAEFELAY